MLGIAGAGTRARHAPITNSTGPTTRERMFSEAKNARERRTVSTAWPTSSRCSLSSSARAVVADSSTAPSPIKRPQIRRAIRRAVAGRFEQDRKEVRRLPSAPCGRAGSSRRRRASRGPRETRRRRPSSR